MSVKRLKEIINKELQLFGGSLNKLALHHKLPYSTLWNLLNRGDEYDPDKKTIEKIATGLGVDINYILTPIVSDSAEPEYSFDDVDRQIIKAMRGMEREEKKAVLQHIEDQKLLKEIKRNR